MVYAYGWSNEAALQRACVGQADVKLRGVRNPARDHTLGDALLVRSRANQIAAVRVETFNFAELRRFHFE